jgi:hypothetical protein
MQRAGTYTGSTDAGPLPGEIARRLDQADLGPAEAGHYF